MNFLCQLSNTLINCCSQLSAVVQMSLITNAPIGPTPPFALPLPVSCSPLPLPPSQLVFPAALALQGTRCQRSRNCVLIMLHCFLDCFQPSGSLISNLYDTWKAKGPVYSFCLLHLHKTRLYITACKPTTKPHRKSVICIVWLICLVATNCQAGVYLSNRLSLFTGVHRARWWKRRVVNFKALHKVAKLFTRLHPLC